MGLVYEARNHFGAAVVLKMLHPELAGNADVRERFRREGQIQYQLRHPNIVRVTDILEENEVPALVVDFMKGRDLERELTQRGALPLPEVVSISVKMLDALAALNGKSFERFADPDIQTRIAQYEMAYRLQSSVPELTDFGKEPQSVLDLYGPEVKQPGSFAGSALLARRLVERGVRVVQIMHRGWDSHGDLPGQMGNQCKDTDQGCAALVQDLKQRGMLDDVVVVWGGEFGRTVYSQGTLTRENYGRDHHPRNFCMWLAGGGVKGGVVHGETDDFSYSPVADPVHINQINATILACLGIDHDRFTFKFQGLDQRLTGVESAPVIKSILA
jgi:serine/threonine protein kinase